MDRTATMTFLALRRTKWATASFPRPVLEPVTMIVWLVKSADGGIWGRAVNWVLISSQMVESAHTADSSLDIY